MLLLMLAPACGQPANGFKPLTPDLQKQIDALFQEFDNDSNPGYALGIIRDGKLIYQRGYGIANLDYAIPITPRSVFNVASLAKQFTAACIGILIMEGKLSLDDPLKKHISEFPDYQKGPVRLKHLIYMTSGIKEYYRCPRPGGRDWHSDYFSVSDAIRASLSQAELQFAPGSRWEYSNVNYMLLAEIVARLSGITFAEFAEQHIFQPLGMTNTHFNDDVTRVIPNRVIGYNRREGGGYHHHHRHSPHYGGSGLMTSIEDLAIWVAAFESHALRGPALTKLLLSRMTFDHPKNNDAFGLVWDEYRGMRLLRYDGGDQGFSSYMARFPDQRFSIICLSNLGSERAGARARQILDLLVK